MKLINNVNLQTMIRAVLPVKRLRKLLKVTRGSGSFLRLREATRGFRSFLRLREAPEAS